MRKFCIVSTWMVVQYINSTNRNDGFTNRLSQPKHMVDIFKENLMQFSCLEEIKSKDLTASTFFPFKSVFFFAISINKTEFSNVHRQKKKYINNVLFNLRHFLNHTALQYRCISIIGIFIN